MKQQQVHLTTTNFSATATEVSGSKHGDTAQIERWYMYQKWHATKQRYLVKKLKLKGIQEFNVFWHTPRHSCRMHCQLAISENRYEKIRHQKQQSSKIARIKCFNRPSFVISSSNEMEGTEERDRNGKNKKSFE